jgi:hypothetical protein
MLKYATEFGDATIEPLEGNAHLRHYRYTRTPLALHITPLPLLSTHNRNSMTP